MYKLKIKYLSKQKFYHEPFACLNKQRRGREKAFAFSAPRSCKSSNAVFSLKSSQTASQVILHRKGEHNRKPEETRKRC